MTQTLSNIADTLAPEIRPNPEALQMLAAPGLPKAQHKEATVRLTYRAHHNGKMYAREIDTPISRVVNAADINAERQRHDLKLLKLAAADIINARNAAIARGVHPSHGEQLLRNRSTADYLAVLGRAKQRFHKRIKRAVSPKRPWLGYLYLSNINPFAGDIAQEFCAARGIDERALNGEFVLAAFRYQYPDLCNWKERSA